MSITAENIGSSIPYYLSSKAKEGIVNALSDFPKNMNYYTAKHHADMLQGDGWSGLEIFNFTTAERKAVNGIILSNTCDFSPENKRDVPSRVVFAPLVKIASYENLLRKNNVDNASIAAKLDAIRNQRVTSLFYLPRGGSLDEDCIAVLDDLHNVPADHFQKQHDKTRKFVLSQAGFYLFLFKLSIHFCRFHEEVLRDNEE